MVKLTFFLLLALVASAVSGLPCYNRCRFRFCDGETEFKVGVEADVAFTGPICKKYREKIGHIDETGEALVVKKDTRKFIPISKWEPDGLEQNFSPSFFKAYGVNGKKTDPSGIGHEVPQKNQADFLDGVCFIVPINSYQVLDGEGDVVENVHPYNPTRNCVAFKAFT